LPAVTPGPPLAQRHMNAADRGSSGRFEVYRPTTRTAMTAPDVLPQWIRT
jgi:hypothetical protein